MWPPQFPKVCVVGLCYCTLLLFVISHFSNIAVDMVGQFNGPTLKPPNRSNVTLHTSGPGCMGGGPQSGPPLPQSRAWSSCRGTHWVPYAPRQEGHRIVGRAFLDPWSNARHHNPERVATGHKAHAIGSGNRGGGRKPRPLLWSDRLVIPLLNKPHNSSKVVKLLLRATPFLMLVQLVMS